MAHGAAQSSSKQPGMLKDEMRCGKTRSRHAMETQDLGATLHFGSQRSPKSTETQKGLKWPKSDSKATRAQKWPKSDSKVTPDPIFESLLRHLGSLWGGGFGSHFWVTFGSLWSFGRASVDLGERWLPKATLAIGEAKLGLAALHLAMILFNQLHAKA